MGGCKHMCAWGWVDVQWLWRGVVGITVEWVVDEQARTAVTGDDVSENATG